MKHPIDISGKKFGKLTAICRTGSHGFWNCICDCGNKKSVRGWHLLGGDVTSCGCKRKPFIRSPRKGEHGMSLTPEYNTWRGMWERCTNPNHEKFSNYGAKNVTVHPTWKDFATFFKHVGPKPSPKHSLDRFPNKKGNYEPGNVRWATQRQQCRNSARNVHYTAFGKTMCLTEWAEEVGMSVQTLSWRINHEKQSIEVALRPVIKRNKSNAK